MTGVRDDGYHLLDSEMVLIDLADSLTFQAGSGLRVSDQIDWTGGITTARGGFEVPADATNLVVRALQLCGVEASIALEKRIPAGAGLGGGSADAAAVLRHFEFTDLDRAASLGSDVPFCLVGGRAQVTGVGEKIRALDYEEQSFVVVTPSFGLSTVGVYRRFDDLGGRPDPKGINDLTAAALSLEPKLIEWMEILGEVSGIDPVLAGSGSSIFVECALEKRDVIAELVRERVRAIKERALVTPATTVRSSHQRTGR